MTLPPHSPPSSILVTHKKMVFSTFQTISSNKKNGTKNLGLKPLTPGSPPPTQIGFPNILDDFKQSKRKGVSTSTCDGPPLDFGHPLPPKLVFSTFQMVLIKFGYFDQTASQAPPHFWTHLPKMVFSTFQMILRKKNTHYKKNSKKLRKKKTFYFLRCRVWRRT